MNLTEREIETVKLIAQGYADKDIAVAMDISPHTVRFHISNIARKMGVSKKVEIAMRAVSEGLV
jgi:two-component system response regulator DevR